MLFFSCILIGLFALMILHGDRTYGDENIHFWQIGEFFSNQRGIHPGLTTLPVFHALFAFFGRIFGVKTLSFFRFLNFLFAIASLGAYFFISKKFHRGSEYERTLQFFFLPNLFSYFFLVYTDIVALCLYLISFYCILQKKYTLSAIFGALSLAIRQLNIFWYLFTWIFGYTREYGYAFRWKEFFAYSKKTWIFLQGFFLYASFVLWNRGVPLGDREAQYVTFGFGNIFMMLLLSFFLFFPIFLGNIHKTLQWLNGRWVMLAAFVPIFWLYAATPYSHKYNQPIYAFYIHNIPLEFFRAHPTAKIAAFAAIATAVLSLLFLAHKRLELSLVYVFAVLSLLPLSLIEPRYSILPLITFNALRPRQSRAAEWLLVLLYIFASAIFFQGIAQEKFFL